MGPSIPRASRRLNAVRLVLVVLAVTGIGTLAAGCGGTSAAGSTTTTAVTTTTTTSTTAAPRPDADEDTILIATAATLQASDFPDGWTEHRPSAVHQLGPDSCGYVPDGPEAALLTGAAQSGPTMQLGDRPGFITSTSYVFADTELADEWLDTVRSDEWAECRVEQTQALQERDDTGVTFELESRENDRLGQNGFEAYAELRGYDADGQVVASIAVMHYQLGRVVIEDTAERTLELDADEWQVVDVDHHAALVNMWGRLNQARPNG